MGLGRRGGRTSPMRRRPAPRRRRRRIPTATAVSSSRIDLAWTDNSTNETGFAIERSLDGATFTPLTTVGANVRTYANTGLTVATTYYYRVRATHAAGPSAWSNVANADGERGTASPSHLTATAVSSSQINLRWTDRSTNETAFVIERSTNGILFSALATVEPNVTTYSDTGLAAFTRFLFYACERRTLSVTRAGRTWRTSEPSGSSASWKLL